MAIADDEQAMEAGTQAIARRRAKLGIDGLGPDEVFVYVVDHFVENLGGGPPLIRPARYPVDRAQQAAPRGPQEPI